jgi:hypothetical protein
MEKSEETKCLIEALFELSGVIESEDGMPNVICSEAACRMRELSERVEYLEQIAALVRN